MQYSESELATISKLLDTHDVPKIAMRNLPFVIRMGDYTLDIVSGRLNCVGLFSIGLDKKSIKDIYITYLKGTYPSGMDVSEIFKYHVRKYNLGLEEQYIKNRSIYGKMRWLVSKRSRRINRMMERLGADIFYRLPSPILNLLYRLEFNDLQQYNTMLRRMVSLGDYTEPQYVNILNHLEEFYILEGYL